MSSSVETCREVLRQKPYDRSSVATLEQFVTECAASNGNIYDFEIMKALLKLYNVYPDESKVEIVVSVLAMALMQLPNTDFLSLSCMVPLKNQRKEPLKTIFRSADCLERCKFGEFWDERNAESVKSLLSNVTNFDHVMRQFIFASIRSTFQNMPVEKFQRACGFKSAAAALVSGGEGVGGAEYSAFVASCGDAIESVNDVSVEFNQKGSAGVGGLRGGVKVGERNIAQQGRSIKYEEVVKFLDAVRSND